MTRLNADEVRDVLRSTWTTLQFESFLTTPLNEQSRYVLEQRINFNLTRQRSLGYLRADADVRARVVLNSNGDLFIVLVDGDGVPYEADYRPFLHTDKPDVRMKP